MHPGAAHLLQADRLADDHLGHPRAAEVHARVAFDHDHDVAEGRDVRPAGRGRPEQAADLRHPAGQHHLVVEDPPGTATAREQLHLVGDPSPGRVHQPEHRQLLAQRRLGSADDLLHCPGPPRTGLDGRVVGDHHRRAAADQPPAGDHSVRRQPARQGVGQLAVLDEGSGIDEQVDPDPDGQLALGVELGGPGLGRRQRGAPRRGHLGVMVPAHLVIDPLAHTDILAR